MGLLNQKCLGGSVARRQRGCRQRGAGKRVQAAGCRQEGAGSEGTSAGCRTRAWVGSVQLQPGWLEAGAVFCRGALRLGGFFGFALHTQQSPQSEAKSVGVVRARFGAGVSDFFFLFFLSILLLAGNIHPLQRARLPLACTELSLDTQGTNPPENQPHTVAAGQS